MRDLAYSIIKIFFNKKISQIVEYRNMLNTITCQNNVNQFSKHYMYKKKPFLSFFSTKRMIYMLILYIKAAKMIQRMW